MVRFLYLFRPFLTEPPSEAQATHGIALHYPALLCIALHCLALHCLALHALHCFALLCVALHHFVLHCLALHRFALLCLHCFALPCIALHCLVFDKKGNINLDVCLYNFSGIFHGVLIRTPVFEKDENQERHRGFSFEVKNRKKHFVS